MGDQSFPERIPGLSSHWGKEPAAGRWDVRKEEEKINKKEREREEVELYIIAHCIIYIETRGARDVSVSLSRCNVLQSHAFSETEGNASVHTQHQQQPTNAVNYSKDQLMLAPLIHVLHSLIHLFSQWNCYQYRKKKLYHHLCRFKGSKSRIAVSWKA